MFDLLHQSLLTSIMMADTPSALALLREHQAHFLDPIEGAVLHAELLYCAMKQTNQEITRYLLRLPILSDIAFFKFCGQTPISLAVEEDQHDLIPLLLTKTNKDFALHMAVKLNLNKTVKFLLSQCAFKDKFLRFLALT